MKPLDLQEWMMKQGHIENGFEFAGIANGLKLFECDDAEQIRRVEEYRRLRPIKAKREKGVKYYNSKDAFSIVLYGIDMFEQMKELQPCGHPLTSIVGDVTKFCGECADAARMQDYYEGKAI